MKLLYARVTAFAIDCLLLAVVLIPLGLLLSLAYRDPTGPALWEILVFTGSIPSWTYFILSDRSAHGATVGKRLLKIQVRTQTGRHLPGEKAALRTVAKMLPWELFNVLVFKLAPLDGSWGRVQTVGVLLTSFVIVTYGTATVLSRGERSFYDHLIETRVRFTKPPTPGAASPQRRGSKVITTQRKRRRTRSRRR